MDVQNSTELFLVQDHGKVNRLLAERIWNWEQESRQRIMLPKLEYSVRSGLRLVESLVQKELVDNEANQQDNWSATELEQEGLTALLDAMRGFRDVKDENVDFEAYCRQKIRRHLRDCIGASRRPLKLPQNVLRTVQQARLLRQAIAREHNRKPTWGEVARDMGMPERVLQDYLRLAVGRPVRMESTVEIHNPGDSVAYADQDDWELEHGMLLDTGNSMDVSQVVEEFLDEQIEYEGDDQAWILQHDDAAVPLSDIIVDAGIAAADETAFWVMIQSDVSSFLEAALDPLEVKAVRTFFGLDSPDFKTGTGPSASKSSNNNSLPFTAKQLHLSLKETKSLLQSCMRKLRDHYTTHYVGDSVGEELESL